MTREIEFRKTSNEDLVGLQAYGVMLLRLESTKSFTRGVWTCGGRKATGKRGDRSSMLPDPQAWVPSSVLLPALCSVKGSGKL